MVYIKITGSNNYFNSKHQTTCFSFKVIFLESKVQREGFFLNAPWLRCYRPLGGIHAFKRDPHDEPLYFGEKR